MNMKRTIPLFTFAVVALLAAGRAYALDVYVSTAGSNDNDGGDWDHALLSITDAYARVAAAGGGTVHVAGGIYRSTQGHFTAGAAFTPANDVTLAGSADPANPTIITGDQTLDNKWEDGSPQWVDGVLQLPPEDACLRPSAVGANDTDFLVATAAATNCVFRDLTIHGFATGGISLDGAENVRFENCRFVGIGNTTAHPTGSCLTLANGAGVVSNCLFAATTAASNSMPPNPRRSPSLTRASGAESIPGRTISTLQATTVLRGSRSWVPPRRFSPAAHSTISRPNCTTCSLPGRRHGRPSPIA